MTLKTGREQHRKDLPYAFTEQGVAVLSTVLRSPRAIRVNIEIMRAFVRLRKMLATNAQLAKKIDALEKEYDPLFKVMFDAARAKWIGIRLNSELGSHLQHRLFFIGDPSLPSITGRGLTLNESSNDLVRPHFSP